MLTPTEQNSAALGEVKGGHIGRIPVRNLWLLMLYASNLFRELEKKKIAIEENPDDIPDLVAEILARQVESRLKRNLTFGYRTREATVSRVRGRIDLLQTERRQLLDKGMVACRFDELTVDTLRNRYVRAALDEIAQVVGCGDIAQRCRSLAATLRRIGVNGEKPGRADVSLDRFGRHDADDRGMVAAAHLAFNLALPTEEAGEKYLSTPGREVTWIRRLYEKGIAGFYDAVLGGSGWRVEAGKALAWPVDEKTAGVDKIMPAMRTDIILSNKALGRRIVIDTKFNSIITKGWYREESLRSGYIYQIYAYLRSQEEIGDALSSCAAGLLLHPAVDSTVDETVVMQGHQIRFATVDLGAEAKEIRRQLLRILD